MILSSEMVPISFLRKGPSQIRHVAPDDGEGIFKAELYVFALKSQSRETKYISRFDRFSNKRQRPLARIRRSGRQQIRFSGKLQRESRGELSHGLWSVI